MPVTIHKITTFTGHNGSVYAMAKGLSEHTFFTGSSDRFVAMWNLETLQAEKFAARFPAIIYTLLHIPEKQLLLVGTSAGSIHILDLQKKEEIKILQHHKNPVFDLKYDLESGHFFSVGGDGHFAICSLETLSLVKIKKLCEEKVRSIDIHKDNSEIAVASGDCNIRIFDLHSLEEKHVFTAQGLSANIVRYFPGKDIILTGGRDAHLNVWNSKNYAAIQSIPAHNYAIYDIVFNHDASLFATASRDKTLKIWDGQTFGFLGRINKENCEGHLNSVNKLLWSSYRDYLISAGDDRAIMVWEIDRANDIIL